VPIENLARVNERDYAPQTRSIPFTVPVGTKTVTVSLTRVDWPAVGEVARIKITWPDGDTSILGFHGGVNGSVARGGTVPPAGLTNGVADVEVIQALRTAISVDAET
jgi:hypothetical protein